MALAERQEQMGLLLLEQKNLRPPALHSPQALGSRQLCIGWQRDSVAYTLQGPDFLWMDKGSTKLQAC